MINIQRACPNCAGTKRTVSVRIGFISLESDWLVWFTRRAPNSSRNSRRRRSHSILDQHTQFGVQRVLARTDIYLFIPFLSLRRTFQLRSSPECSLSLNAGAVNGIRHLPQVPPITLNSRAREFRGCKSPYPPHNTACCFFIPATGDFPRYLNYEIVCRRTRGRACPRRHLCLFLLFRTRSVH